MRRIAWGILLLSPLFATSCNKGVVNPPLVSGTLEFNLRKESIDKCKSIILEDVFKINSNLTGISFVEVRKEGQSPLFGRYPNSESKQVIFTESGNYSIRYLIQDPEYPEKIILSFECKASSEKLVKSFIVEMSPKDQIFDLVF